MRILVKIKPKAKENKIERINDSNFKIQVKEAPEKGKANAAVRRIVAEYFNVSLARVKIISGLKSRNKIIEIN